MVETFQNIGWALVFSFAGGLAGILLVLAGATMLPHLINRLTPAIDEEKEVARGNLAVAEYFGRVTGAAVIGLSIVVGAAVLGGIIAALQ